MPGSSKSPADEHVKLELVSEQNAIVPGKEFWLGIRFGFRQQPTSPICSKERESQGEGGTCGVRELYV
jgi:hypothetical protein